MINNIYSGEREFILNRIIERRGLTKTRIALMMNVSRTTVHKIIQSTDVRFEHAVAFARVISMTVDFVYDPVRNNERISALISKLDYTQSEELIEALHTIVDLAISN